MKYAQASIPLTPSLLDRRLIQMLVFRDGWRLAMCTRSRVPDGSETENVLGGQRCDKQS